MPSNWLRAGLICLLGLAIIVLGLGYWLFGDLPAPQTIYGRVHTPSIRFTDREGRLLYEALDAAGGRQSNLALTAIPLALRQATIATEDRHFYTNPGVDLTGIVRALWINVRGGEVVAGGSTITQQVARNLLLEADERTERTLRRKLRESWLAWRLGRTLAKDDILALYLNQIYYGALTYGVEAASQTYFGKPAAELTLAEAALLAGLPQAPALYNPFTTPDAAKERQLVVLGLMQAAGFISQNDYAQAVREPLRYSAAPYPMRAPHFVLMAEAELGRLVSADTRRSSGGLVVRTTLNLDWQTAAEDALHAQLQRLNAPPDGSPGHNAYNAALTILDPRNGDVLALIGNPDYFDAAHSGAVNMATAPRQTGSALKPVIYAAALAPEQAQPWTAATLLPDVRAVFVTRRGEPYIPINFSRRESGPVLLRQALASSLNIPAVRTLDKVGLPQALAALDDFGLRLPGSAEDYDLALALGGGEIPLLDLTRAYAVFANGGSRVAQRLILDVQDAQGGAVYTAPPAALQRVIDARVAWLISDILSDDQARALGFGAHSLLQLDRAAAVKTGTTNDFRDNWTVGYTPDVVVGVWVGNADHQPMRDVTGISGAGPIWRNVMRQVLTGVPDKPFARPDGLVQLDICGLSGQLPTQACPYRRAEWFIVGTQPTQPDRFYRLVWLDRTTNQLATAATPPAQRQQQLVLDLPPEFYPWARAQGLLLLADLAPAVSAAQAESVGAPLHLIAPAPFTTYRLSSELPPTAQQVRIEAVGSAEFVAVTLYLDDHPLVVQQHPPYITWWPLQPGQHTVWAVGEDASGRQIMSESVSFNVRAAVD